jgi:hypothetical protein
MQGSPQPERQLLEGKSLFLQARQPGQASNFEAKKGWMDEDRHGR